MTYFSEHTLLMSRSHVFDSEREAPEPPSRRPIRAVASVPVISRPAESAPDGSPTIDRETRSPARRGEAGRHRHGQSARTRDNTRPPTTYEEPWSRKAVRTFGEVLITLGLIVLLFAAYEVYGKAWQIQREQGKLTQALDRQWDRQGSGAIPDEPIPGQGVARLHIPKLGKDWVVVEGVKPRDIKSAPGHYPDSQMPDKLGNFAVAGHRTPAIFWNLDKMSDGDTIIVETRKSWYVYRVTKTKIIKPTQLTVVAANPENPGAPPKKKMLTLTTCNPKWDNYQRLVVHAEQIKAKPKSTGRPAELGG